LKPKEYFGELLLFPPEEEEVPIRSKSASRRESAATPKKTEVKDEFKEIKMRQTSVYATTNAEVLCLSEKDFSRFISPVALKRMRTYAKGYPKESEIRALFYRQKRWNLYKHQLVQEIVEEKTVVRKQLQDEVQTDIEEHVDELTI
jgi:hypothetical protein